jgi:putative sigma-54 modulation protein
MSVDVRFKKLDHSDSLVQHMNEKIEKILVFCKGEVNFHFDVSLQGNLKRVDLMIHYKNQSFSGKALSDDFYTCVDMAVSKVMKQIKKQREKMKAHRNYVWKSDIEEAA